MLRAAAVYDEPVPIVDVQDPRFLPPGDMPARIDGWCAEHGGPAPRGRVATVRCIVHSLAAAVATALERAASLAGRRIGVVHVVGGGSQNTFLCQAIADRTGLPVLAGPVEATALGNVLVQARTAGVVGPGLADLRALVARTHDVVRFEPTWLRGSRREGRADGHLHQRRHVPRHRTAVVTLLRRLGVDVDFPQAQTCCGQPMVNTGYLDEAVPPLRSFVDAFDGYDAIVTPSRFVCRVRAAPARASSPGGRATPAWWPRWNGPRRGPTSCPSSSSTCSA